MTECSGLYAQAQERYAAAARDLAAAQIAYDAALQELLAAHRLQLRDDATAAIGQAQLALEDRLEQLAERLPTASTT